MADQKLIGVIDLLRQSQDETKEEIVTTRHSIQVMNNEIVKNLKILAGNVETAEEGDCEDCGCDPCIKCGESHHVIEEHLSNWRSDTNMRINKVLRG